MDIKKDILWRVYITFILLIVVGVVVLGKAFQVQQIQGKYWRGLNDSLHQKTEEVLAERGSIYSEDGKLLSTSVPQFDVYIDFGADGLRANNGKQFYKYVDSLGIGLSNLFGDYTSAVYSKILKEEYKRKKKNRYFLLQKNINYNQFKAIQALPLVRLGRNASGFIYEVKSKRLNPYSQLAFRTIGLARDSFKVGLELAYDSILKGKNGSRTVRYIAGGVAVPINDGLETEAEHGKDIVSTLDIFIQEITHNALQHMMVKNNAEHGCAIVMETKTGKIKGIANLGFDEATGNYIENKNYSLYTTEPGSTFKLATILALLDDGKVSLNTPLNIEGGRWQFNTKDAVIDAEEGGHYQVTMQQAFELSSNVGMAKMVWNAYRNNPTQFINKLKNFHLDSISGIDLVGERKPIIKNYKSKYWYQTTLPWMSFGYEVQVSPLQTLMLYNAVANNGKMVKPYLVSAIKEEGVTVQEFSPIVIRESICSPQALQAAQQCLLGVTKNGTAKKLFANTPYLVAGKTGTSYVAEGDITYSDKIYQSSFAGYFPANNPQYTCVVVIRNKQNSLLHFGADVAGPVFKEISDKLYATPYVNKTNTNHQIKFGDTSFYAINGFKEDILYTSNALGIKSTNNISPVSDWASIQGKGNKASVVDKTFVKNLMPNLKNSFLKDALFLCESLGLKMVVKGTGKINSQSVPAGTPIKVGQQVIVSLN